MRDPLDEWIVPGARKVHSNRIVRAWRSITEPRHLKLAYLGVYLVALLTGIGTLMNPPQTIEGVLGSALTFAWSVFLIAGGFGGMLTVLPGWWWAERLSIVLIFVGLGIYLLVVTSLQFATSGSRVTQIGVIVLAAAPFVIRLLLTRKYSFEPRG